MLASQPCLQNKTSFVKMRIPSDSPWSLSPFQFQSNTTKKVLSSAVKIYFWERVGLGLRSFRSFMRFARMCESWDSIKSMKISGTHSSSMSQSWAWGTNRDRSFFGLFKYRPSCASSFQLQFYSFSSEHMFPLLLCPACCVGRTGRSDDQQAQQQSK